MNPISYLRGALVGTDRALAAHRALLQPGPGIESGLQALEQALPATPDEEPGTAPVFLFSAGWRSGSTLLQRLLMSDPRILVWGEPFDECGPLQALSATLPAFRPGWPPAEYYHDGRPPGALSGDWVANLFPALADWRAAHRAFIDTLLALPARRTGLARWGLKEVRLGLPHALYLRWLYPTARFVFLYRDPYAAYRSYCRYGRSWYDIFPQRPVFTPGAFGRHWRALVQGFLQAPARMECRVVRYEALLRDPAVLEDLRCYLGLELDAGLLGEKVGSSERAGRQLRITRLERWLLSRAVDPVARDLGYTG